MENKDDNIRLTELWELNELMHVKYLAQIPACTKLRRLRINKCVEKNKVGLYNIIKYKHFLSTSIFFAFRFSKKSVVRAVFSYATGVPEGRGTVSE